MPSKTNTPSASELFRRAATGNIDALGHLLETERERLRRMITLRLDPRLKGRLDPSDVIQDTFVCAARRFPEYVDRPELPFYLWLRRLAAQQLIDHFRRHLGAQSRNVVRESAHYPEPISEASSAELAVQLLGRETTPCAAAIRAEQRRRLQHSLDQIDPIDREILALRHFEQLSNSDAAAVLGLDKSAASKRYARALVRLKDVLHAQPGSND